MEEKEGSETLLINQNLLEKYLIYPLQPLKINSSFSTPTQLLGCLSVRPWNPNADFDDSV